jgi:hypothetical protein
MFKVLSVLCLLFFLAGCSITDSQLKTVQPGNNNSWKPDQTLMRIRAERILLESPMSAVRDKDGNVILDKQGQPIMEVARDKDGNPDLAEMWVKDTSAKPPLTILDIVKSGLGYGVVYGLGYKGLGVIGMMSEGLSKSPLVVQQPAANNNFIMPNSDGSFDVKH